MSRGKWRGSSFGAGKSSKVEQEGGEREFVNTYMGVPWRNAEEMVRGGEGLNSPPLREVKYEFTAYPPPDFGLFDEPDNVDLKGLLDSLDEHDRFEEAEAELAASEDSRGRQMARGFANALCALEKVRPETITTNKIILDAEEEESEIEESDDPWEALIEQGRLLRQANRSLELARETEEALREDARNFIDRIRELGRDAAYWRWQARVASREVDRMQGTVEELRQSKLDVEAQLRHLELANEYLRRLLGQRAGDPLKVEPAESRIQGVPEYRFQRGPVIRVQGEED